MATQTTIGWMINYLGTRGLGRYSEIIEAGKAAGHNPSTLRHYMGSAALYGHVDPKDCAAAYVSGRRPAPRRPVYFERPNKGWYGLAPKGEKVYEQSRVKHQETGYNSSMQSKEIEHEVNPALETDIRELFSIGRNVTCVQLVEVLADPANSYEDTLYLTVNLSYFNLSDLNAFLFRHEYLPAYYDGPELADCEVTSGPDGVQIVFTMWSSEATRWKKPGDSRKHHGVKATKHENLDHHVF